MVKELLEPGISSLRDKEGSFLKREKFAGRHFSLFYFLDCI